jgi:hypothetical protein
MRTAGARTILASTTAILLFWAALLPQMAGATPRTGPVSRHPQTLNSSRTKADFNNDGMGDLAVSAPGKTIAGKSQAGSIFEFLGSTGFSTTGSKQFTEATFGLTPGANDHFGSTLATGDFNGDGFSDLAVGDPGIGAGSLHGIGLVVVVYGSATGLDTGNFTVLHQGGTDATDPDDAEEANDNFGYTLAVGNFSTGSQDDLVVGSAYESVGGTVTGDSAGAISVFFGSSAGLTLSGHQFFTLATPGVPGPLVESADFGVGLAAGNFGMSSLDDVAIGVEGASPGGASAAGSVVVLYGTNQGLTTTGALLLYEGHHGIPGTPAANESFGRNLGAGDFDGDGFADLAIDSVGETVAGHADAGEVFVLGGGANGLMASNVQAWTENNDGVTSTSAGDNYAFGDGLGTGDWGNGGKSDLAIGATGAKVGSATQAGQVVVLYGGTAGLSTAGSQVWSQDSPGIQGTAETFDFFGSHVSGDILGTRPALVITSLYESVGPAQAAGAFNIIYATSTGLSSTDNRIIDQATAGVVGNATTDSYFGAEVTP